MKPHAVKVPDVLWSAAMAAAEERGEILSEEIRAFLTAYVNRK